MKDNKYKIIIDNEVINTYDNVLIDNNLLYKKNIDKNLYNKILSDTEYYNVYNKTIKYILKKRRSEKEIKQYLTKFEISQNELEKMITKLKDLNFINDLEYCKAYINDKIYLSKNGINKIRIDLIDQDIPINIIEEQLKNIDKAVLNERLEKMIIKKINNNRKYSNNHLKQKILTEMITLGYSKDMILEIIEFNIKDEEETINIEFNKLYNKFKIKCDGDELKKILKQKLISKGFSFDKINKIIQEKTED